MIEDIEKEGKQGKHGHEWIPRFDDILPDHEKCKWCGRVRIKYRAGGETKVLTKYKYKGGKPRCLSSKEKEEKRKFREETYPEIKKDLKKLHKEREEKSGGSRKTVDVSSHIRNVGNRKPVRVKRHRRSRPDR